MKGKLVLHPYLFVLAGVLSLIANNITEITISSLRVLLFSTIACTAVLLFLYVILKDTVKAGLISSVATLLIFTHGHVKSMILANVSGDPTYLVYLLTFFWWLLFFGWIYVVLRVLKTFETISNYFTVVSIILLVFPLYSLLGFYIQRIGLDQKVQTFLEDSWEEYGIIEAEKEIALPEVRPDIYYIILDSYGRSDILEELYGYDNTAFHTALESRGFYVATESRSNYAHTGFSLSSSMNMMLINSLPEYVTQGFSFNKEWLVKETAIDTLQSNRLMDILREQGYQIVAFDTGFESINFPDADYQMVPEIVVDSFYASENIFEIFLLEIFGGGLLGQVEGSENNQVASMFDAHRERIRYTFDNMDQFASQDGEYFVFVHLIAPHPPYVFGPNGEEIGNNEIFTLDDVTQSNRNYRLYVGELQYLNTLLLDAIDRILAESDVPPIIIVQGDHGTRLSPDNPGLDTKDKIQFPIFNTYFLPGIDADAILCPSISPVNTFRIVLNTYFETELDLIEDQSFDWASYTDYEFIPVCEPPECY